MKQNTLPQELTGKNTERRVLGIGAGRGNPFPNHYGFEIALDKIGGEFLSYADDLLIEKTVTFDPTHIIVLANISAHTSRYLGKIRGFRKGRYGGRRKTKNIQNAKIGWWFWDLRPAEGHKTFKGWQDHIFLCNLEYKDQWRKAFGRPVTHMPQAAASKILHERYDPKDPIKWDFYFMGSWGNNTVHGARKQIFEKFNETVDKYKLEVRTSGARDGRIRINHSAPYYYKNSPFVLDISAEAEGYTSNRAYDILAYEGFLVIRWFKGIEKMFEDKKHCVYFKTVDDLVKIADYYYKHPKERLKIKKQGHELYLKKHTFEHRLDNMLDILDGRETEYRGYL